MTRTIEMQKNMMTLIICIKYVVVVILAKIFKRASVAGQGRLLKHGRFLKQRPVRPLFKTAITLL